MKLTPDEIFELANRAARGGDEPSGARSQDEASPDTPETAASPAFVHVSTVEPESFQSIVEAVTQVLTSQLQLPSFREWRAAYLAAPDQYDDELLGLWREGL